MENFQGAKTPFRYLSRSSRGSAIGLVHGIVPGYSRRLRQIPRGGIKGASRRDTPQSHRRTSCARRQERTCLDRIASETSVPIAVVVSQKRDQLGSKGILRRFSLTVSYLPFVRTAVRKLGVSAWESNSAAKLTFQGTGIVAGLWSAGRYSPRGAWVGGLYSRLGGVLTRSTPTGYLQRCSKCFRS